MVTAILTYSYIAMHVYVIILIQLYSYNAGCYVAVYNYFIFYRLLERARSAMGAPMCRES